MRIGNLSFSNYLNWMRDHPLDDGNGDCYFEYERECRIVNCSSLREISIGHMAFTKCQYVCFEQLHNLEIIQFGRNCFQYVNKMEFKGT